MDHQGLAHLLPPPTTEVTTLRPYHHLTRLSAPLLLALLLTVVTKKQIKLKQSLLCSWPSNGSHVSQNQIPYKGLTSSTCPFHVSNHFLHSFKHGSSHGSPGCSWPTDTSLPQSLCYCSYSATCTGVPGYLHGSLLQLRTHMSPSQGNLHWSPTSTLYPFTYIHTTLLSWFIYPPNTYHLFFLYIHFIIAFLPLLQSSLHEARKVYFVHPQPLEQHVTHRKEKVKMLVTHSCPTLCNPMDYSLPCSSVCEILQARIVEWIAIPFSWGSSQARDRTLVSCTAGRFFTPEPSGKSWHIGIAW